MKLQLHGVHITLNDTLREQVEHELRRPLERLVADPAAELEVHLCDTNGPKGGLDKEVRLTLHLPGRAAVHMTEASEELEKSLRLVHDRVTRVVKRELERV